MGIAIVATLARSALAIVGALVQRHWASRREPSNIYVVNVLTECLRYRLQVQKHVAWRLARRPGAAPVLYDLTFGEAVASTIALHSPADIAEAAQQLLQQTQLLGKEFVRLDPDDQWMPDRRDWGEALAEWELRADTYRGLEEAYRDLETDLEKVYQAQRAGIFNRLVSEVRLDRLDAEEWIVSWEYVAEATGRERGSQDYWEDAWRWIEAQRHPPKVDKTDMSAEGDDGQVFGG